MVLFSEAHPMSSANLSDNPQVSLDGLGRVGAFIAKVGVPREVLDPHVISGVNICS
jgi:hypothetical protein